VERFPAHTPRPEDEPKSELPKKARFELRKTLVEVLANDLADKEKAHSKKHAGRAKNG